MPICRSRIRAQSSINKPIGTVETERSKRHEIGITALTLFIEQIVGWAFVCHTLIGGCFWKKGEWDRMTNEQSVHQLGQPNDKLQLTYNRLDWWLVDLRLRVNQQGLPETTSFSPAITQFRGTMSIRKSNISYLLMAIAMSFLCSVLRLFSSVCTQARMVSSLMKISAALANRTGASLLIIWLRQREKAN